MKTEHIYYSHPIRAWIITLLSALFFFYGFLQVNMMSAFNETLQKTFHVTQTSLSLADSTFFYATLIFIIPAGLIIDRFSIRKIIFINMLIIIVGTLIFAFAKNMTYIAIGRFISGIIQSFALISCLKIATYFFPPNRIALVNSLVITIGMLGGFAAELPVEILIKEIGWRETLITIAALGFVIMIILLIIVKIPKEQFVKAKKKNIFHSLKLVLQSQQNWFSSIFITTLNFPLAILGALFGISFLQNVHGFTYIQAASTASMLFIGFIFGSPFFGWISDYLCKRRLPMFLGAISCLVLVAILIFIPNINLLVCQILFLLIGFTSSAQVIGYPIIEQNNSEELIGTALSMASLLIMGLGYGLILPFVGELLDLGHKISQGLITYSFEDYQKAFLTIPIGIIISLLMIAILKEPGCKTHKKIIKEEKK